jgi:hypothetical protein
LDTSLGEDVVRDFLRLGGLEGLLPVAERGGAGVVFGLRGDADEDEAAGEAALPELFTALQRRDFLCSERFTSAGFKVHG